MRTDIEGVISALENEFNTDEYAQIIYTKKSGGIELIEVVFYFDEGQITMCLWDSGFLAEEDGEDLYQLIKSRFKKIIERFKTINNHITI